MENWRTQKSLNTKEAVAEELEGPSRIDHEHVAVLSKIAWFTTIRIAIEPRAVARQSEEPSSDRARDESMRRPRVVRAHVVAVLLEEG